MPLQGPRAPSLPALPTTRRRPLRLVAFASVTGSVAMAAAASRYAIVYPQTSDFAGVAAAHQAQAAGLGCIYSRPSDFAGVAAAHQAQAAGLGCIYSRSVQLAGDHLVHGVIPPPVADDLIWHFNEPPLMTLIAAPFAALRLAPAG